MRGRGYARGGGNSGRHDPFRSRPQNTSRPPSMHVDDFVKMENQGQAPSTGSNQGANVNQPHRGRVEKVCYIVIFVTSQILRTWLYVLLL